MRASGPPYGVKSLMPGYELDEAGDGAEAIRKLEKGNYDLLLLDINMPGKSGLDVLKFIKEKNLHCRIIMLSGRLGFSVATEALKLGADEYITKPFSVEFLLLTHQESSGEGRTAGITEVRSALRAKEATRGSLLLFGVLSGPIRCRSCSRPCTSPARSSACRS